MDRLYRGHRSHAEPQRRRPGSDRGAGAGRRSSPASPTRSPTRWRTPPTARPRSSPSPTSSTTGRSSTRSADIVPAVKPQIAMYEALGPAGVDAYTMTCEYAQSRGPVRDRRHQARRYRLHRGRLRRTLKRRGVWRGGSPGRTTRGIEDAVTVNPVPRHRRHHPVRRGRHRRRQGHLRARAHLQPLQQRDPGARTGRRRPHLRACGRSGGALGARAPSGSTAIRGSARSSAPHTPRRAARCAHACRTRSSPRCPATGAQGGTARGRGRHVRRRRLRRDRQLLARHHRRVEEDRRLQRDDERRIRARPGGRRRTQRRHRHARRPARRHAVTNIRHPQA